MKKILLTRPRASGEKWAALLATRGFDCVLEPLLTITPTYIPRPDGVFDAIWITSANALEAIASFRISLAELFTLPCFCVGSTTAEAARTFGFTNIRPGPSDSAALAQMALGELAGHQRSLLHIAGDVVDGKAQDLFRQRHLTLTPWIVYRAMAVEDFSAATKDLFTKRDLAAIPVFSPRSAHILVSLIEKNSLAAACGSVVAVGLSQAVADVLQTLPWRRLHVAATPDEIDVLACLENAMTHSDPVNFSETLPLPRKKKGYALWLISFVLLALAAGVGAVRLPLIRAFVLPNENQDTSELLSLRQRVDLLEAHVSALTEIPPAPQSSADVSALAQTIKNLEAELSGVQAQGNISQLAAQHLVATSLAFWDLREAAKTGRPFVNQLAALKTAADGDIGITEEATKIEPFANAPPLTMTQLRENLGNQPTPEDTMLAHETSLWGRVRNIMHPLISVRSLHDPELKPVDDALASGDAVGANNAFTLLPSNTQQALASWHNDLVARMTLDVALQNLTTHFIAPQTTGAP